MRDLHDNLGVVNAIAPQVQTGTLTSAAVDLTSFDAAMIVVNAGAIVTSGSVTPSLTECATSGGTYTAVAAGDILGTVPAVLAANTTYKFSYIGTKPFIKVVLTFNSGTSVAVAANVIEGRPARHPVP